MKKIFAKVNFWNLFIGIAIGAGVGMYMFTLLVPSGLDMIRLYNMEKESQATGNVSFDGATGASTMNHATNPYIMGKITSEKQFVQQMKLHHEAAIVMANQALQITLRPEVKTLANNIVSTQTTEVKMMKDWLASWWK